MILQLEMENMCAREMLAGCNVWIYEGAIEGSEELDYFEIHFLPTLFQFVCCAAGTVFHKLPAHTSPDGLLFFTEKILYWATHL